MSLAVTAHRSRTSSLTQFFYKATSLPQGLCPKLDNIKSQRCRKLFLVRARRRTTLGVGAACLVIAPGRHPHKKEHQQRKAQQTKTSTEWVQCLCCLLVICWPLFHISLFDWYFPLVFFIRALLFLAWGVPLKTSVFYSVVIFALSITMLSFKPNNNNDEQPHLNNSCMFVDCVEFVLLLNVVSCRLIATPG